MFGSCCSVFVGGGDKDKEKGSGKESKEKGGAKKDTGDKPSERGKEQPAPAPAPKVAPAPKPKVEPKAAAAGNETGAVLWTSQQKSEGGGTGGGGDLDTASNASTVMSNRSGMSSIGSEFINDRMGGRRGESGIQKIMKGFVKGMVKGKEMSVLSVDGQLRNCTCSFDRKLKNFVIEINQTRRKVPLSTVNEVCQGNEPEDIDTPLDDLCSTLVVESGECITFRFNNIEERENFAMCLQILVDGQQR